MIYTPLLHRLTEIEKHCYQTLAFDDAADRKWFHEDACAIMRFMSKTGRTLDLAGFDADVEDAFFAARAGRLAKAGATKRMKMNFKRFAAVIKDVQRRSDKV